MKYKNHNHGNVLFIILIGIVLFAGFIAAVRGSNSGGGSQNKGLDSINATNIIRYGNTVKSAVDSLRQRNVSESDMSFANDVVTGYGTVGANPEAEVFHIQGGGISYETPEASWLDGANAAQAGYGQWIITGSNSVRDVGTPIGSACASVSCQDLILILPYIKQEICVRLNTEIADLNGVIYEDAASMDISTQFTGNFVATAEIGDAAPFNMAGITQGCIKQNGVNRYHYYQVLIAR